MSLKKEKIAALVALAFAVRAAAQGAVPQVVAAALEDFSADIARAEARYAATTNRLVRQYAADIDALRNKYQSEGLLDEYLAAKKEADRFTAAVTGESDPFEEIPAMPYSCIVYRPEQLRSMQMKFMSAVREAGAQLRTQRSASADKLLAQIERIQKELTRKGRIDEAIEVRSTADKVRAAAASGRLPQFIESMQPRQEPDGPAQKSAPQRSAAIPAWRKWKFVGEKPFSPDLKGVVNLDLITPVVARNFDKMGKAAFATQRGLQQGQQVGGVICEWVGAAVEWNVPSPDLLPVRMSIRSGKLSPRSDRGPKLFIYVMDGERVIQSMPVELMQSECEVRIVRDTEDTTRFAIHWPGARRARPFTLEGGAVRLIVGVAMNGALDTCDTTVQFLQ